MAKQREIHEAHRRLKTLARLDSLTNIPNRRHFDEILAAEWKRCAQAGRSLRIAINDIDFFKQLNAIYGHQAGDSSLSAVANTLNEPSFRAEDIVARYGGEALAAILPRTDSDGTLAVAERMRRSARELCIPHKRGIEGFFSCSFSAASIKPVRTR